MASGVNRKILADATLKGGNVFKNYASKVVSASADKIANEIKKFPLKGKKK